MTFLVQRARPNWLLEMIYEDINNGMLEEAIAVYANCNNLKKKQVKMIRTIINENNLTLEELKALAHRSLEPDTMRLLANGFYMGLDPQSVQTQIREGSLNVETLEQDIVNNYIDKLCNMDNFF